MAKKEIMLCKNCGKKFLPKVWNQIYCGSKTKKIGCSYKMHLKRIQKYIKENYEEYMRVYTKKWHKLQRQLNTAYSERQRKSKREKAKTKHGKEVYKNWRRKNIAKVLVWNRKRLLRKKGVIGSHTFDEWESLKKKHSYKCVICGISEEKLKTKWNQKGFNQLTRDHIVPISKGGTDYIENIQPLCISCNARKWANTEVITWVIKKS